jgi:hypothetical protein
MRSRPTAFVAASLFGMLAGTPASAQAQVECAKLLTAAEVQAAAGPGFESLVTEESQHGKSLCVWLLDRKPDPKAISVTFWTRKASAAADLAQLFETQVQRAEGLHQNKREMLKDIGSRVAFVPGKRPGAMKLVIVQTKDGIAYVETDYLEREQVLGVAKAIIAP